MGVRDELGIPQAATFIWGVDGEIHIGDIFGGTWCEDFYVEADGTYGGHITSDGPTADPLQVSDIHERCVLAARDE